MKSSDSQPERGIPLAGEYLERLNARMQNLTAIKDWRAKAFEAGRPSGLADYYRAHGFCPSCRGMGLAVGERGGFIAIGWDGSAQLYQKCRVCDGSGKIGADAQLQ